MTGDNLRNDYFKAMRSGDLDAVLALFDDNATVVLPDGRERAGRAALAEMYAGIFSMSRPEPSPGVITGAGDYWAVEVTTRLPDGRARNTANFFYLNDRGLIARMHSYSRG
jgi:ketosteroid isomerase-like protein